MLLLATTSTLTTVVLMIIIAIVPIVATVRGKFQYRSTTVIAVFTVMSAETVSIVTAATRSIIILLSVVVDLVGLLPLPLLVFCGCY